MKRVGVLTPALEKNNDNSIANRPVRLPFPLGGLKYSAGYRLEIIQEYLSILVE